MNTTNWSVFFQNMAEGEIPRNSTYFVDDYVEQQGGDGVKIVKVTPTEQNVRMARSQVKKRAQSRRKTCMKRKRSRSSSKKCSAPKKKKQKKHNKKKTQKKSTKKSKSRKKNN